MCDADDGSDDDGAAVQKAIEAQDKASAKHAAAIKDCKTSRDELKTLQPSQIVDAVQKVIKLIQDGTKDLDTCKQTQQDMDAVEAWAENIAAHPSAIINNVLAHLSSLIGEISKTVGECDDASKHAQCGDDISEIVVEILGHVDDKFEVETIDWNNVF